MKSNMEIDGIKPEVSNDGIRKESEVTLKRRRNGETDYRRRMKMLRGVRSCCSKSNKYSDNLYCNYEPTGDTVHVSVDGKKIS